MSIQDIRRLSINNRIGDDFMKEIEDSSWKRNTIRTIEKHFFDIFVFLILLLIFLICLYRIFATSNYTLKYTYNIAVFSLYMMIFGVIFKSGVRQIEERREKGKRFNTIIITFASILSIISLSLTLYSFISINFSSSREIILKDLTAPSEIWISKISNNDYFKEPDMEFLDNRSTDINIKSPQDIEVIISDLESKKIKNLPTIDVFNFLRMKSDSDYYTLFFEYEDYYFGEKGLDDGYIFFITIISHNQVVIEERYYDDRNFLVSRERIAYYPIEFSDEAIDLINSYIK